MSFPKTGATGSAAGRTGCGDSQTTGSSRSMYALTMPLVAIATTYVYFDRRVVDELEQAELPAETELPG